MPLSEGFFNGKDSMVEDGRNRYVIGSQSVNRQDIAVNREPIETVTSTLLADLSLLGIQKAHIEGLPLYVSKSGRYDVQNWGTPLFRKGWKTVHQIAQFLQDADIEVEVSALLDNTQSLKVPDTSTWKSMKDRLKGAKAKWNVPLVLEQLIEGEHAVLEAQYGVQNPCAARDARYQLSKIRDEDGSLRRDRLYIIIHPSEFTDEQKKMNFWLDSLIANDPQLRLLSPEKRREYISTFFRVVWINNSGDIVKGVTHPLFTANGKCEFNLYG